MKKPISNTGVCGKTGKTNNGIPNIHAYIQNKALKHRKKKDSVKIVFKTKAYHLSVGGILVGLFLRVNKIPVCGSKHMQHSAQSLTEERNQLSIHWVNPLLRHFHY